MLNLEEDCYLTEEWELGEGVWVLIYIIHMCKILKELVKCYIKNINQHNVKRKERKTEGARQGGRKSGREERKEEKKENQDTR